MTVTILPDLDASPQTPRPGRPRPSRAVAVAAAVASLVVATGGWLLLRGGSDEPTPSRVSSAPPARTAPPAPALSSQGPAARKNLAAVAAPMFAAANTALGGWTVSKTLLIRTTGKSMDSLSKKIAHCAGVTR